MGLCKNCGKDDPKSIKFCVNCGNSMEEGAGSGNPPVSPKSNGSNDGEARARKQTVVGFIKASTDKIGGGSKKEGNKATGDENLVRKERIPYE